MDEAIRGAGSQSLAIRCEGDADAIRSGLLRLVENGNSITGRCFPKPHRTVIAAGDRDCFSIRRLSYVGELAFVTDETTAGLARADIPKVECVASAPRQQRLIMIKETHAETARRGRDRQ